MVLRRLFRKKARTVEEQELKERSKEIEQYLKTSKHALEFKVLLLGSGESGKSTVLKQLKSIYKVDPTPEYLKEVVCSFHVNSLQAMNILITQCKEKEISFDDELKGAVSEIEMAVDSMRFEPPFTDRMTLSQAVGIHRLWKSSPIQTAWEDRANYWIFDNTPYFFENILRFVVEDYHQDDIDYYLTEEYAKDHADSEVPDFVPSEEDIVMARIRTIGVTETEFFEEPIHWRVIDPAGQRGERRKWINFFDDAKGVIFLVNLAGYNSVCWEEQTRNQMTDALDLFKEIANLPNFFQIPMFLFLNKKDLFETTIRRFPMDKVFSAYQDGEDVGKALDFLEAEFFKLQRNQNKELAVNHLAARYKKDVKYAWEDVRNDLVARDRKMIDKARKKTQKERKKFEKKHPKSSLGNSLEQMLTATSPTAGTSPSRRRSNVEKSKSDTNIMEKMGVMNISSTEL